MQGGIGRNEWPVSGVLYAFFHSCESSKDSTSWQHTFSSVSFLLRFIFKVHKFLSNYLLWSILYSNLTHFLVHVDLPRIIFFNKTPSLLIHFSFTLHPRYIDCFQIIKLRTVKLTKRFLFKDGGPAFYLCFLWPIDVHSMFTLHVAALQRPCPFSLCWAWHGCCRSPHSLQICWPQG
jgi:hypothetical protein